MEDKVQIEPKPEVTPPPVMDITPPPIDGRAHNQSKDHAGLQLTAVQPESAPPAALSTSDNSGSGVGMAITATVLIVLGLAVLATYAYIKTVHS